MQSSTTLLFHNLTWRKSLKYADQSPRYRVPREHCYCKTAIYTLDTLKSSTPQQHLLRTSNFHQFLADSLALKFKLKCILSNLTRFAPPHQLSNLTLCTNFVEYLLLYYTSIYSTIPDNIGKKLVYWKTHLLIQVMLDIEANCYQQFQLFLKNVLLFEDGLKLDGDLSSSLNIVLKAISAAFTSHIPIFLIVTCHSMNRLSFWGRSHEYTDTHYIALYVPKCTSKLFKTFRIDYKCIQVQF